MNIMDKTVLILWFSFVSSIHSYAPIHNNVDRNWNAPSYNSWDSYPTSWSSNGFLQAALIMQNNHCKPYGK